MSSEVPGGGGGFQIFIKNLVGKTVTLQVRASNTIQAVKQQIHDKDISYLDSWAGVPV